MRRVDPGRFAASYVALSAVHRISEYITETDAQTVLKAGDWRRMAGHLGTAHALQAGAVAALRTAGVRPSGRRLLAALACSVTVHVLVDLREPLRRLLELAGAPAAADPTIRRHLAEIRGPVAVVPGQQLPVHRLHHAGQTCHHAALTLAAALLAADPPTWRAR